MRKRIQEKWMIRWDDEEECWRICIREKIMSESFPARCLGRWGRILWLRFASKDAARQYVDLYGVPGLSRSAEGRFL